MSLIKQIQQGKAKPAMILGKQWFTFIWWQFSQKYCSFFCSSSRIQAGRILKLAVKKRKFENPRSRVLMHHLFHSSSYKLAYHNERFIAKHTNNCKGWRPFCVAECNFCNFNFSCFSSSELLRTHCKLQLVEYLTPKICVRIHRISAQFFLLDLI